MSKFCGKCGSTLNENGLCPNCDSDRIETENANQSKASREQRNVDNSVQDNTYPKEPTKKEKKIKSKADKAAAKVKKKADEKIGKLMAKADKKSGQKSDKSAAKIKSKADKKAKKITVKFDKKANKKAAKAAKKASRPIGKKIGIFLLKLLTLILAIVILFTTVSGVLVYFNIADVPVVSDIMEGLGIKSDDENEKQSENNTLSVEDNTESTEESYEVTMPDADEYYKNNSKIISEVAANKSDKVTNEKETLSVLKNRGFSDYPVTAEYSMDGEYYEAEEISESSSAKHPIYETYYVNTNGDVWTIFVINGIVMANPVSYNIQSSLQAQLVITEAASVTSYDSTTNKFYETIPNDSELIVKKVNKINAETLNKLTVEGIDKL